MDITSRFGLILLCLFLALTGHAQNQRVTSLTAGVGGLTNSGIVNLLRISGPTALFTATLGAAGNLDGDYTWYVTYLTAQGETDTASTASESPASQRVTLSSIPIGPAGVTARRIYRTTGANPQTLYLLTTLNNNTTTTYEDNTADASLTGPLLSLNPDNTAGGDIYVNNLRVFHAATNNVSGNFFAGYGVAYTNQGHYNTGLGFAALQNATNVTSTTAVGHDAARELLQGDAITAVGEGALRLLRYNGNYNSAVGVDALGSLTNGLGNSGLGRDAGFRLLTGTNNLFLGHFSGEDLVRGSNNVTAGAYTTFTWDTNNNSSSLGAFAEIHTNNVVVIGGAPLFARPTNIYFGPYIHATPSPVILNAPSGLGANIAGGNFSVAAGASTGNGAPGAIPFLTSGSGGSGSSLNALVERGRFDSNGLIVASIVITNSTRWVAQTNSLAGSGSTNLIIDTTQPYLIRCTVTANFGLLFTNIVDGVEGRIEIKQDTTGNRFMATPYSNGGGGNFTNTYWGTDITPLVLSTNGGYVDQLKWVTRGTNVLIVGALRGYPVP